MFNELKVNADKDEQGFTLRMQLNQTGQAVLNKLKDGTPVVYSNDDSPADILEKHYATMSSGEKMAQARTARFIAYIVALYEEMPDPDSCKKPSLNSVDKLRLSPGKELKDGLSLLYRLRPELAPTKDKDAPWSTTGLLSLSEIVKREYTANRQSETGKRQSLESLAVLRDRMSRLANHVLLISEYGNPEPKGIAMRLWLTAKTPFRNAGRPFNAEAHLVLQAMGNSILAITDELSHAESWELSSRVRALQDLIAVQASLYGEGFSYLNVWQLHCEDELVKLAANPVAEPSDEDSCEEKAKRAQDSTVWNSKINAWRTVETAVAEVRESAMKANDLSLSTAKVAKDKVLTKLASDADKEAKQYADKSFKDTLGLPSLIGLDEKTIRQADVANAMLSTLRASRLKMLLDPEVKIPEGKGPQDAVPIVRIDAAISQLEGTKAESIPLRPAGAILRTTYPVTGHQRNGSKTPGNMMTAFVLDAIPVFGEVIRNIGETIADPDRNLRFEKALDQAFWQPINFIQVQGAGTTNYVVVKDDVGNWYVKNYSADPKVAFDSLSKLLATYYVPGKRLAGADILAKQQAAAAAPQKPSKELVTELEADERNDYAKHSEEVNSLGKSLRALADGAKVESKNSYSASFAAWDLTTAQPLPERAENALRVAKDFCLGWRVEAQDAYDKAGIAVKSTKQGRDNAKLTYDTVLSIPTPAVSEFTSSETKYNDAKKTLSDAKVDLLEKDSAYTKTRKDYDKVASGTDNVATEVAHAQETQALAAYTEAKKTAKSDEESFKTAEKDYVNKKADLSRKSPAFDLADKNLDDATKANEQATVDMKSKTDALKDANSSLKTFGVAAAAYLNKRSEELQNHEKTLRDRLLVLSCVD